MRRRKTNDRLILQYLNEGKTQTEIAKLFGVSAMAISKRVKKLLYQQEIDKAIENATRGLTPKQKEFCIAVAQGASRTQAAMLAYDCSSKNSAAELQRRLMKSDDIRYAINELMEIFGLTKGYRISKLKSHVDHPDPLVSLKALDLSWKLDGSYAPEKHEVRTITVHEMMAEVEKLKRLIEQTEAEIAELEAETETESEED